METITLKQASEALQGFCINHSHYNFWKDNTEEAKLLSEAKALKFKVDCLINKQAALLERAY